MKGNNVFWHSGGVMSDRSRYTQAKVLCTHRLTHQDLGAATHPHNTFSFRHALSRSTPHCLWGGGVMSDTRRLCFLTPGQPTGRFYCARDSSLPNLTESYSLRTRKATCFSPPISWRFLGPGGLGGQSLSLPRTG